jgi:hypothetical protein
MQAGVTDINTIRIYSAIKQGLEKILKVNLLNVGCQSLPKYLRL